MVACADATPFPEDELLLRVSTSAAAVDFGKDFPLTVQRVWAKELQAAEWNDRALDPLVVRLLETDRRDDGRHVEETRRYLAYAFTPETVTLPRIEFAADPRDGGPARKTSSEPLELLVRPALGPGEPGPPELPGDLLAEPFPWWRAAAGIAVAFAAAATLVLRSRRRARRASVADSTVGALDAPPPPTAQERALDRLRRLRDRQPQSASAIETDSIETAALLRDYTGEIAGVHAEEMTTEELTSSRDVERVLASQHRDLLRDLLGRCDLVKFARAVPGAAQRERLLDDAARFVSETGPATATAVGGGA